MNIEVGTAMILLLGIVGYSVINNAVGIVFDRLKKDPTTALANYITRHDCERCAKKGIAADEELKQQFIIIRRVVMAMAIKMGIDTKDIQELM